MTLASRIKIAVVALLAATGVTFGAGFLAYQAHAEGAPPSVVERDIKPENRILLAQADTGPTAAPGAEGAGSASAPTPDVTQPAAGSGSAIAAPTTSPPQVSDVGVVTKLWKDGAFFGAGIMALYLGLFVWMKVDKKHAFYASTGLAGVAVIVESIRRGDTPNAMTMVSVLMPTIGILIAGPGHTKAPTAS